MRRHRRAVDSTGALGGAGWLFAELAMIMMIVAFGASELPAREAGAPAAAAASTSVPAPTSAPPEGLSLSTVTFRLPAERLRDPVTAATSFQQEMEAQGVGPDVRVGLVLLFGVDANGAPGGGTAESRALADALEEHRPPQLESAQLRAYIGKGDRGSVEAELFVVTGDL